MYHRNETLSGTEHPWRCILKLSRLIEGIALTDHIGRDCNITSLTCDTNALAPGALFAAFKGSKADGTTFIDEAIQKGAVAVLCETPPDKDGPWLVAENARETFALLAANWFGHPGDRMTLLAVTGTNGKTTTTYLLKSVLEQTLHAKVGLIGTNQNLIGEQVLPAERTTPDAYTLQSLLAQMVEAGCTHVVMEVSSHALALHRTAGLRFAGGIFTNLTRDHLDFHKTMEAYRQAKERLFYQCDHGLFNVDDKIGRIFAQTVPCIRHTFGEERSGAELVAKQIRLWPDCVEFTAATRTETAKVHLGIPGDFTVYNALGVLSCCLSLGLPLTETAKALRSASGVKGRVEVVPIPAPYTVIIDYAHTPDALEKILETARAITKAQLICLFGCGGDRDHSKRPVMGEIAAELSDFVVLTSDNPRTEPPEQIMKQVAAGFPRDFSDYLYEPSRAKAIHAALSMGRAGDVILLAGKGHETEQIIGTKRIHFDEREEIAFFFRQNTV